MVTYLLRNLLAQLDFLWFSTRLVREESIGLVLESLLHLPVEALVQLLRPLIVLLRETVLRWLLEGSSQLVLVALLPVEHVPARLLVLQHEVEVLLLLLLQLLLLLPLLRIEVRARPLLLIAILLVSSRCVFLPVTQTLGSPACILICNVDALSLYAALEPMHLPVRLDRRWIFQIYEIVLISVFFCERTAFLGLINPLELEGFRNCQIYF